MAISLPMTAEAVVAYLGIVLAGCVAVCIADSFAAGEVGARLRAAAAKAIVTQASGVQAHWLLGACTTATAAPCSVSP